MHGRIKVKTTAQQEEEKRKEREKKLHFFRKAYAQVLLSKERKEFDEVLAISGQLLTANPDFYTLWNYRKEIFEYYKDIGKSNFGDLCTEDLHLTEQCIGKNPKSYGAWHHRQWILQIMPNPNWERELKLCNSLLQLDERNFHCWGHRRKIFSLANVSPEDELKFTLSKIESNFSNYSAWHYRSSLLPLVYPGPPETKRIAEDKLLQEYELVQNAVFTDPNDQSAWFYHRWLLGRVEQRREIILLYVSRITNMAYVVLSKALKKGEEGNMVLKVNNQLLFQPWETRESWSATVWVQKLPNEIMEDTMNVQVVLHHLDGDEDKLECQVESQTEKWQWKSKIQNKLYRSEQNEATTQVLKQELESCQQLQELEPNKWTNLTLVLLMRALSIQDYHTQILEHLDWLEKNDSLRKKYYQDLRSKCVVEKHLDSLDPNCRQFHLPKQKLTMVPHVDRLILMQEVDLSDNKLSSTFALRHLLCVRKLILDGNNIQECSGLERLQNMELISLKNNYIISIDSLLNLKGCSKLKFLFLEGNPCYDAHLSDGISRLILNA